MLIGTEIVMMVCLASLQAKAYEHSMFNLHMYTILQATCSSHNHRRFQQVTISTNVQRC